MKPLAFIFEQPSYSSFENDKICWISIMLQREHSAILLTFIKLPFVIKIFVLSILEWPFFTGFTVYLSKGSMTFIKLPFVIKIFVLSILEWPFYTGFTVYLSKGSMTFIKLPFVIKIFVLSILEWPFYTGLTVYLFKGSMTSFSCHLLLRPSFCLFLSGCFTQVLL